MEWEDIVKKWQESEPHSPAEEALFSLAVSLKESLEELQEDVEDLTSKVESDESEVESENT